MITHRSDCAVHNEPAMPADPCDCGETPGTRAYYRRLAEKMRAFVADPYAFNGTKDSDDLLGAGAATIDALLSSVPASDLKLAADAERLSNARFCALPEGK